MNNDELLSKLYELGRLPSADDDIMDDYPLDEFDHLLKQISTPVTPAQALRLINLSPPANTGCFGVEWALVHLVETISIDNLQNLLKQAIESEAKRLLQIRLENYKNNNFS